jgi:nitroreductase
VDDPGVFETIYSLRQITRYKPDPVPREALDKLVDAATKAPSGGNRQPWELTR